MQSLEAPLGLQFHATIPAVAHPAAETLLAGALLGGRPIAHPLHLALHIQPPALEEGSLAARLAGGKEAALGDGGTPGPLDAARREGIAGQPAQWR